MADCAEIIDRKDRLLGEAARREAVLLTEVEQLRIALSAVSAWFDRIPADIEGIKLRGAARDLMKAALSQAGSD